MKGGPNETIYISLSNVSVFHPIRMPAEGD